MTSKLEVMLNHHGSRPDLESRRQVLGPGRVEMQKHPYTRGHQRVSPLLCGRAFKVSRWARVDRTGQQNACWRPPLCIRSGNRYLKYSSSALQQLTPLYLDKPLVRFGGGAMSALEVPTAVPRALLDREAIEALRQSCYYLQV